MSLARSSPGRAALALLAFCVLLAADSAFARETVRLATLEWPPYTGERLANQGASAAVVKAAFTAAGLDAEFHFYPWTRAVMVARNNPAFVGYFPEYHAEGIEREFIFSSAIGEGPLGFVELADRPVRWETLKDLRGIRIGAVQDYVNTEEFDRMAASGELTVEYVTDDITNIRKVLAGRIRLAVIDKNVLEHLLATEPEFAKTKDRLAFNARILENKQIYVCFRRSARGERLAAAFNEGLDRIDAARIASEAMAGLMGKR